MATTSSHTLPMAKHSESISLPSPLILGKEAFHAYCKKFFSLLLILGIPLGLFFALLFGVFGMAEEEAARITPGVLFSPAVFLGVVLFGAFVLLLQVWGGVALLYAVTSERPEAFWISYGKSFPKIGSYVWILILLYLISVFGFTLFILPGIYLFVSISFALFVFFDEGLKGVQALQRSFDYVKGNFWGVFFHLCVVALLGTALGIVFRSLFSLFVPPPLLPVAMNLALFLILIPLGFLYMFRLFTAIRNRKPLVREEILHDHLFQAAAFLGLVIVLVTPFLTLRGARRFMPRLYPETLDIQKFFALGFGDKATAVRSGPQGEELLRLQNSRDEKRLSDTATFALVFDSIASKHAAFCEGFQGKVFKSTTGSGGGTNWFPVDLRREGIEGSIVTHTPRDPVNTSQYHYAFACSSDGKYEINIRFEYPENFSRAASDGGSNEEVYEAGSNLSLIP